MNAENIFEDEWRACLRAHFFHVIKEQDSGNERSLTTVLLETGFAEDEIEAMRAEALDESGWTAEADQEIADVPAAEQELMEEAQLEIPVMADGAPENESKSPELPVDADEDEPPGPPVQLSLF
jgi:hypothetical protein